MLSQSHTASPQTLTKPGMMSTSCRQDASDSFGDFAKRRREWAGNPAVRAEYSPGMHTTKNNESVRTTRQPARGGFPLDSVGRLSLVYGNQSARSMSMSRARSADPECRSGVGEAPTIEFPCCSLPFRDCSRAEREHARVGASKLWSVVIVPWAFLHRQYHALSGNGRSQDRPEAENPTRSGMGKQSPFRISDSTGTRLDWIVAMTLQRSTK